jgi:hypothetical protein
MEVLKVDFEMPNYPLIANAAETTYACTMAVSTKDHAAVAVGLITPDVFAYTNMETQGAWTVAGSYAMTADHVRVFDCTDGAGHGVLVATDTLYCQLAGGASWATSFNAKILYRLKNVSLAEYIGIVQSQQ